jgi:SM-20-related protein
LKTIDYESFGAEAVADVLATSALAVIDNFIERSQTQALFNLLKYYHQNEAFRKAGVGNQSLLTVRSDIRGDYIKWLNNQDAQPAERFFLEQIWALVQKLEPLLFISIKDVECHFAIYPPGSAYEAHLDQFNNDGNRILSFAFYLNHNWKKGDGGEMRVHGSADDHFDIPPLAGRLVLFRSDKVLHEVLPTQKHRYSLTGWLLSQPKNLPFVI